MMDYNRCRFVDFGACLVWFNLQGVGGRRLEHLLIITISLVYNQVK